MSRLTVSRSLLAALMLLLGVGGLAQADVVTTETVEPGPAGTQEDPWEIEEDEYGRRELTVGVKGEGYFGTIKGPVGTLDITDGGVVSELFRLRRQGRRSNRESNGQWGELAME